MSRLLLAALLLVLTVAGARAQAPAQDPCLTGASTLGDQRAIAALRADTETVCPCDTATSSGRWRRCAKTLLKSVLAGGTLRAECEKTQKLDIRNASCGSSRTPCGRVQRDDKTPAISCKVKKATGCTDKSKYDQTACADQDFCADVVDWTAGTSSDVRVRGPFQAGARTITMTKKSVVNPSEDRVLDVVVWYPTTPGAGPIDGATQAVLNAPLDDSGGPYPVLLFSHGSCGYPLQSIFLTPVIASRGYIVIAPPHPGNTLFEFPNCGTPAVQVASAQERPQDMIFALDQMLAANADSGSDFFGALDPSRIGMSGHSFGGFTTYFVANQDSRIKVAVPMAPAAPGNNAALHVPSLLMLGAVDSVVNLPNARQAYTNSDTPKYKVEIEHAGHYAFSNLCFPSADCNPPTTLTQDEAHDQVLRWVIPFLEWKLKGDATFAAFFDSPPPGVQFDAQP
jgi:predicted dienelactone hydrolase